MAFEQTPGAAVALLSRLFSQAVQSRFTGHGATPAQYPVLEQLWREDGLTQHELCHRIRIEQPTMANTLKRMERDGLVRKVPDDNDRRKVRIRVTPKARRLRETLEQAMLDVQATMVRGLDEERLAACLDGLAAMAENLSSDLEQPPLLLEDIILEPVDDEDLAAALAAPGVSKTAPDHPAAPAPIDSDQPPAQAITTEPGPDDDLTSDADILVLRD